MVTTGCVILFESAAPAATPSSTAGDTLPCPVPYSVIASPRRAGLAAEFPAPPTFAATNTPGAFGITVTVLRPTVCPPPRTSTGDCPAAVPDGIWKLICPADA